MPWIKNFDGFLDFLSLVIVHAPSDFPKEDYLREDEQLTLERAFDELRVGMRFVKPKTANETEAEALSAKLEEALAAYRQGDDVRGAHLLQDFERVLQ